MKRPEVTVGNCQEVYDLYEDNPISYRYTVAAHRLFATAFRSEVRWGTNAEEQVRLCLNRGGGIFIAANHTSTYDPLVLAGLLAKEETLSPMLGHTFIPSKQSLFKNKLVRVAIDQLGAIPVMRKKDNNGIKSEEATDRFIDTCVKRINGGQHMAIFPESTRNEGGTDKVQKLREGLGRIACATDVEPRLILPVGISNKRGLLHPDIFIHDPIRHFPNPTAVTEELQLSLQKAVDLAHGRYGN